MSYIETIDSENLMVLASDIRAQYNKLRFEFNSKETGYFRQSISSQYHKEDDLIEMLSRLKTLKTRYIDICNVLKGRGLTQAGEDRWRDNNNHLFVAQEILHVS